MPIYEVSRTLVKSPPELWADLEGGRLSEVLGEANVRPTEPEKELAWEGEGAHGTVTLEPAGWGTKVKLTAEVEEQVASVGFWGRLRGTQVDEPQHSDMEDKLGDLLDSLGSAHRKPFTRD
jgi:hypothetical protein